MTFEEALKSLENLVEKMESGAMTLEESLKAYEEGEKLKTFCEKTLQKAKMRIEKIQNQNPDTRQDWSP